MNSLVTVKVFDHPTDAHIANGMLQAADIPTHLQNIHHASASWLMSNALGGIQLQVPEAYATEAAAVLGAEAEPPLTTPQPKCEGCGGASFSRSNARWRLSFFIVHLFGIPLRWGEEKVVCDNCGGTQREDVAA